MDEVIPGLFIGDIEDARKPFDGFMFNVLEGPVRQPDSRHGWIPIIKGGSPRVQVSAKDLDTAAENIESAMRSHGRVLVHCAGGIERSPLTVAWFLFRKRGMTFENAYRLVTEKRRQAQRRDGWLAPDARSLAFSR